MVVMVLGAQANPFLSQAKELYQALEFEKCVSRLDQASKQWQSTKDELRDIEVYGGLCQFNLGRSKAAAEHFRTALRIDESVDLPPYTSPKAVSLFLRVKQSLQAPPEPLPDEDLPPDAPIARTLEPRKEPGPSVPSVMERHPAAVGLGIGAGVALAIGVGLGVNARNLSIQANEARAEQEFREKGAQAQGYATAANVAYILAGSAAIAAVVTYFLE